MKEYVRITFIDPTSKQGYSSQGQPGKPTSPHMGLIYLATYLNSHYNAKINIVDMSASGYSASDVEKIVKSIKPHLVGFTARTLNIPEVYKLARVIKSVLPETIILLGGAHATALPEMTLSECEYIDAVVRVEGELTLGEIVERLLKGYRGNYDLFCGVKGVTFRKPDGSLHTESNRDLISDLNSLPLPDFSFINYKEYSKLYNPVRGKLQHCYPVFASRGCPFNCTFCMPLLTRKYRVRDTEAVIEEIQYLHQKWGTEYIYFEDSLFGLNRKWFEDFCEKYIKKGLHRCVHWGFETRIDTAYPLMFEQAKEAGCIYAFFGIESGSSLVLANAKKGFQKEQVLKTVKAAKDAGISKVCASFIFGLPYESIDTLRETFELLEVLPLDGAGFNILNVFPMTDIFKMADNGEGGLKWIPGRRMNWESYSRGEPQATVNDLTEHDLLKLPRKGFRIITRNKIKTSFIEYTLERLAYFTYYLQTDRRKLLSRLKKAIIG